MPPRPAGTDGRDHSYREVIAERYKRMAQFKDSIEKLIGLHTVFVTLKLGWHMAANSLEGVGVPQAVQGLVVGEGVLLVLYHLAKLGTVKESLVMLKVFNMLQVVLAATQVLSGWLYHNGTGNHGEPTYLYSNVIARCISESYPSYSTDMISGTVRAIELFLDLTLAVFLIMGTYVAHRMIVEKMQMKKEKANVMTDRKDAQKGGGEDDDDDDDDAAPAAVPLDEDKPKVVKAASRQDARRRHA